MTWLKLAAAGLLLSVAGCQPGGQSEDAQNSANDAMDNSELVGEAAKASYTMGRMVAQDVDQGFAGTLDEQAFMDGVAAHFAGEDEGDMEARMQETMAYVQGVRQAAALAEGQENLAAGEAFLAENGAREGVTTTESGLQYEVIVTGDGAMPTLSDTVTTHYHGTLIDGEVFDSSVDRGEPASFPVNGVISGWTEALQLMPVGSKWRLFVPADLAYGSQQRGPIPANSTLIFEVELLEIG